MKTTTKWIALAVLGGLMLCNTNPLSAQTDSSNMVTEAPYSPNPGTNHFLLAGSASAMYMSVKDGGNSFMPMTLMLMPLTRISDKMFLETGVKMEMNDAGDGMDFGLEVLNMHYLVTPWLSLHFGKFAAPWGFILDNFGEGFTARFATTPIGLSDDGMCPTDEVGVGAQGGIQAGPTKLNYHLWLTNGPQLITDDPAMLGHTTYDFLFDNNKNKAIGGKLGFLPFSNSCLELDVFGQSAAKLGNTGDSAYEGVSSTSLGGALNFYYTFNPIMIRLRGQYETTTTSKPTNGYALNDSTTINFDNKGNTMYVSAFLRATGAKSKFLSNLEIGGRYVVYTPPADAPWGGDPQTQMSVVLTYYLRWDCPINFCYDIYKTGSEPSTSVFTVRSVFRF